MTAITRRDLLARAAALSTLAIPVTAKPLTKANLGVQLYTVRDQLPKDPAGVLKQIKSAGYTEIEATDYADNQDIWKAVAASGLKPVSVHLKPSQLDGASDDTQKKMAELQKLGFRYAVFPYVMPDKRGGADTMKRLAESLNQAGVLARQHGLQFCYHNHAFEFASEGGSTLLQTLMSNTDPNNLALELDIFWVTVAGQDPLQLLQTYAGRVPLLHLKDKAKGMADAPQFTEDVPKAAFKEVGSGSIDIPAILKAADKAGAQHYFVEQDQSPNPLVSLRQSYKYLSSQFRS